MYICESVRRWHMLYVHRSFVFQFLHTTTYLVEKNNMFMQPKIFIQKLFTKSKNRLILLNSWWTALNSTEQYWTVLNSSEQHLTVINSTEQHWTALNSTEQHWTELNSTEQHWTALNSTKQHWTLNITEHWTVLNSTEHWTVLNSTEQCRTLNGMHWKYLSRHAWNTTLTI